MRIRLLALPFIVLAVLMSPAAAHADETQCQAILKAEYAAFFATLKPGDINFCNLLAGQVFTQVSGPVIDKVFSTGAVRVGDVFSQRDLQNRKSQNASPGGTPAQGEAIPSVQPTGVAAGTIAALGTRAGQDAIAALSVNPFVLFLASEASRQLARGSRLADVTVYIPVSGATQSSTAPLADPNKLRYVGARVRFNFLGLSSGDKVWAEADKILKEQISQSSVFVTAMTGVFQVVPNVKACVDALLKPAPAAAGSAPCDTLDVNWKLDEAQALKLHEQLAAIRRQADSKYFGADIRYDFGDPTLGEVENASGKFLFAGLAVGRRFDDGTKRTSAGVRGRLGVRHAKLDNVDEAEFAAEGGVGFEVSRTLADEDEINVSGAVEFRRGGARANLTDQFQTDFTMLRGTISLPLTKGNSISINVGKPITGDVSPIFSVNFNWGLLLSDRPER
jgi:hypothetical protein